MKQQTFKPLKDFQSSMNYCSNLEKNFVQETLYTIVKNFFCLDNGFFKFQSLNNRFTEKHTNTDIGLEFYIG